MIPKMNLVTEKAHANIRERILSGEFPPGALLSAKDLAEEIGVSRTPIRDALRVLEQEGLVLLTPRQEARVKSASYEECRELCELRIALESYFAALAAERRTDRDLESLKESLDTMRELVRQLNEEFDPATQSPILGRLARMDLRFHTTIIDAARNKLLKQELLRFQVMSRIVMARPDRQGGLLPNPLRNNPMDVWESHRQIYDAIRLQQRDSARVLMEQHLNAAMKVRLETIKLLEESHSDHFV
jgi:DNA-binding GntR family transcriptional regulator